MGEHDEQAHYEYEKYHHDLTQAEAQLHDAGLTTGDLTEAQVFAVANALGRTAASARRAALEEAAGKADAVATGARVSARYFRNAGDEMRTEKWAAAEGAALDIRDSILALIAGAGDGAASAPHPMEAAARLVDEWSAANFRTSAERPDPSALLDLVKRLAARKVEA